MGIVLALRNETGRAAEHLCEALRLEPGSGAAHFNLGVLLERQGRLAEAVGHYEQALRAQPGNPGVRRALEEALRRL